MSEWPGELNLELGSQVLTEGCPIDKGYDIYRYKDVSWNGNSEKYIVKGLYRLCQKIQNIHLDAKEEVIWGTYAYYY